VANVDTTFLLDLTGRGGVALKTRAGKRLRQVYEAGETPRTTRFSAAELYVGPNKARDLQAEKRRIRLLLQVFQVLEFDDRAAWLFGEITAHLHRIGRPVGDMDVLIAATTLAAGEYLITRNITHFANIPGLVVETY
jgi:tRNA(fMet)-specific endonuclease VapC